MAFQINGKDCTIFLGRDASGGFVEKWPLDGSGPSATGTIKCAWEDRYDVCRGLVASVTLAGGQIARIAPYAYPPSPNLYVTSIDEIRGLANAVDDTGWHTARDALITVTFGVYTYDFDSDSGGGGDPGGGGIDASGLPWTETRFRVSAEQLTIPGGTYYWVGGPDDGKPVPESQLSQVRSRIEITMLRKLLPYPPVAACELYAGTTNNDVVQLGDKQFEAGTLLFLNGDIDPVVAPDGTRAFDVTYSMLGNGQGVTWNELLSADGTYYPINTEADGSGDGPYPPSDFYAGLP